ncbi:hypothetical protein SG34_008985 [Thalassomonas viridans]|uniref:Uncharacterized protein n=1 Tax=Thalassomonas viridans TaxID=137584 RepID=A0AAE9Z5A7_9GAMM|nr:hypothetical protein [Thalassomonas viridans]WDE07001.1 hypothetical protein SG34_008985 [Thalassomonas viridans]
MQNLVNSKINNQVKAQSTPRAQLRTAVFYGGALLLGLYLASQAKAGPVAEPARAALAVQTVTESAEPARLFSDTTYDPTSVCRVEPWNCYKA